MLLLGDAVTKLKTNSSTAVLDSLAAVAKVRRTHASRPPESPHANGCCTDGCCRQENPELVAQYKDGNQTALDEINNLFMAKEHPGESVPPSHGRCLTAQVGVSPCPLLSILCASDTDDTDTGAVVSPEPDKVLRDSQAGEGPLLGSALSRCAPPANPWVSVCCMPRSSQSPSLPEVLNMDGVGEILQHYVDNDYVMSSIARYPVDVEKLVQTFGAEELQAAAA